MHDLSEYPVFDGVEFKPEVKELMTLFAEAWEQCRATDCGECHYRHGKKRYSLMACLCERYAEKMLKNGYKRVGIEEAPTIDAVPVVRCRECKHLNVVNRKELYAHCPKTNTVFLPFELDTREHFCSLGERKEGADNR